MSDLLFEKLLARHRAPAPVPCACGGSHRLETGEIVFGEEAFARSARRLAERCGSRPVVWVLSDENTEQAAGARWKSGIHASRIVSRILPGQPRPVPSQERVAELALEVKQLSPHLLVSVGSGVLSDLGKQVSLEAGIPNWCVATAPSVDAYTSATAAIRVAGYHQALPTRVSEVIVCDLEVIARAPRVLFLSGLGDLLAKFLAHLDWILSRIVTGERHCQETAELALGSARRALEAARGWATDPAQATRSLMDAVLVSGLAMQSYGSSRPAASAEHTIAHFWEMAGAVGAEPLDLHGILVGAASRLVLKGYQAFYEGFDGLEVDVEARLASRARELPWSERLEQGLRPFQAKIAGELRGQSVDPAELSRRLTRAIAAREEIARMARPLLAELAQAVALLEELEFPFSLDTLELAEPMRLLPVRNVPLLRNRYTTFDLARELGREELLLDAIAAVAGA